MSGIVLSAGVRSNLLQLQDTSSLITQTQTRLATGKRVNSALDNPNNYFTAQALDNRAGDLNNLLELDVDRDQHDRGGEQRHQRDHQAGAVRSVADQPGQADRPTLRQRRASRRSSTTSLLRSAPLASDSGFNGINLLGGDNLTVTLNEDATSSVTVDGRRLYQCRRHGPQHRQLDWQLGGQHRHRHGHFRSHLGAHHAAVRVAEAQLRPVHRADPPGLHQGDDQHAASRFRRAHARGFERGRRQLAGLADPPATIDYRSVACIAGRPERASPLPVSLGQRKHRNGGLRAAVFFDARELWLMDYFTGGSLTLCQP